MRVAHAQLLFAEPPAQHAAKALPEARLVHIELVGIDGALHDILAQAPGPGDEHHVGVARLGVDGEHDASRSQVTAYHLHHGDRQRDLEMVEALVNAVGDGAVGEQRSLAAFDRVDQQLLAAHIEIGVVLAGEARAGQVFGGGRTAHGNAQVFALARLQPAPGLAQRLFSLDRHCGGVNDFTRTQADARKRIHIALVQLVQKPVQLGPRTRCFKRVAVSLRRDGKAVGYAQPHRRESLEHFAQRSRLAADQRQIR